MSRLIQIKVGLSHSKKFCYISSNESSLKMIKNTFYFILKYLFVLKVIEFFSWLFGYIRKWLDQKNKVSFNIYNITTWLTSNYKTMNFVQSIRYNKRNVFFKKSSRLVPDLFLFFKKALYEIKASGPHLSFNIFGYTLTWHTTKNKLYKTLDLRSRDTLNLDILKKGLGIVSWLHFVDDFSREMFLMLYILLSNQLWLSRCLYLLRY